MISQGRLDRFATNRKLPGKDMIVWESYGFDSGGIQGSINLRRKRELPLLDKHTVSLFGSMTRRKDLSQPTIEQLVEILKEVPEYKDGHHLHRPFLSSYQLAIAYERRYPKEFASMSISIGGKGTAVHTSLAQRIARTLSQVIKKDNDQSRK